MLLASINEGNVDHSQRNAINCAMCKLGTRRPIGETLSSFVGVTQKRTKRMPIHRRQPFFLLLLLLLLLPRFRARISDERRVGWQWKWVICPAELLARNVVVVVVAASASQSPFSPSLSRAGWVARCVSRDDEERRKRRQSPTDHRVETAGLRTSPASIKGILNTTCEYNYPKKAHHTNTCNSSPAGCGNSIEFCHS